MASSTWHLLATYIMIVMIAVALTSGSASARQVPDRALLAAGPSDDSVGIKPTTCCSCKCVIPSKQSPPRCPGGTVGPCVGTLPPTYSRKQICKNGFLTSCDDVCLVDHGSWKGYNAC